MNSLKLLLLLVLITSSFQVAQAQNQSKQAVSDSLFEASHLYYKTGIFDKMVSLEMSPAWWAHFDGAGSKGVNSLVYLTRDIGIFAKNLGWTENPEDFEFSCEGSKAEAKPKVDALLARFTPRFNFTFEAKTPTVDDQTFARGMDYLESVGRVLARENWKPSAENIRLKLVLQPQVKAITVTASPDKKSFTITAPVDHDTNAVVDAMYNGLVRASK